MLTKQLTDGRVGLGLHFEGKIESVMVGWSQRQEFEAEGHTVPRVLRREMDAGSQFYFYFFSSPGFRNMKWYPPDLR